jgi:SAM-dependent methyltransferase
MTDEMLELACGNAAKAGATNVEFVKGTIEDVPLPDASVDVVISNCVINLSVDKPKVLAEMFRVLAPGGRIGISDVVAEDHLSPAERAERGEYVGCIAGALSRAEYLDGLASAGFVDPSVRFTHTAADGMHAAIIRASKPTEANSSTTTALACCDIEEAGTCCEIDAKAGCCGTTDAEALPVVCRCR